VQDLAEQMVVLCEIKIGLAVVRHMHGVIHVAAIAARNVAEEIAERYGAVQSVDEKNVVKRQLAALGHGRYPAFK